MSRAEHWEERFERRFHRMHERFEAERDAHLRRMSRCGGHHRGEWVRDGADDREGVRDPFEAHGRDAAWGHWHHHPRASSLPRGVFMVGAAAVLYGIFRVNPFVPYFVAWIALFLAIAGTVRIVRGLRHRAYRRWESRYHHRHATAPRSAPEREAQSPSQPADPRIAQVDQLCARVVADVRSGPEVLRSLGHDPAKTAEALRTACRELVEREARVRASLRPDEDARLERERTSLAARIDREPDAVVKERLAAALRALDDQLRQRDELRLAATRLEAEHTRLYYTLQSLHAQVLRVKAADAGSAEVAGAGLRRTLEQLGSEIDAIAEALANGSNEPPRATGDA